MSRRNAWNSRRRFSPVSIDGGYVRLFEALSVIFEGFWSVYEATTSTLILGFHVKLKADIRCKRTKWVTLLRNIQ